MNTSDAFLRWNSRGVLAQPLDVISPAPRDVWQDILKSDMQAVVSQTPTWLDCICAVGNYEDASRLYKLPGGQQLVLPMVRRRYLKVFTTQASLPGAWEAGGLVTSGPIRAEEIAIVFADLARQSVLRTSVRPNPLVADVWSAGQPPGVITVPRLAHVLDLEGGFEQVWT
jgi:hypothetical protein